MNNEKLLEWLYSDIDELIDFDGYEFIQEDEQKYGKTFRNRFSSLGNDIGKSSDCNA